MLCYEKVAETAQELNPEFVCEPVKEVSIEAGQFPRRVLSLQSPCFLPVTLSFPVSKTILFYSI